MRQTLTGMVAAIGLMTAGAAPAMACGWGGCCGGYSSCAQTYAPVYSYAPAYTYSYSGCGTCGGYGYIGWGYEHLAAPTTQYYYVNQGPTYTGPGALAPYPAYEEDAVPVEHPSRYGYYEGAGVEGPAVYGYRWHHRYHAWHHSYRYGYARHHYSYHFGPYYYGHRVLRRYY
jgi:hypothetical protein